MRTSIGNMASTATLSSGSKPPAKSLATAFELIHTPDDNAGFSKQSEACIGKDRKTAGSVEHLDSDLRFKIGQRLTDDGLGAPQAAAGGREAACVGSGDEGAQLINREAIQHLSSPSIGSSEKYRLPRWMSRS